MQTFVFTLIVANCTVACKTLHIYAHHTMNKPLCKEDDDQSVPLNVTTEPQNAQELVQFVSELYIFFRVCY